MAIKCRFDERYIGSWCIWTTRIGAYAPTAGTIVFLVSSKQTGQYIILY